MEQWDFNSAPKCWKDFADEFPGNFCYVDHNDAPPGCRWKPVLDWDRLTEGLRRAEEPFRSEVEAAILRFSDTGTLILQSEEARYFLGLRANAACSFVMGLYVKQGGEWVDLVPFPAGESFMSLSRRFLIEWWNQSGYRQVCQERIFAGVMPRD